MCLVAAPRATEGAWIGALDGLLGACFGIFLFFCPLTCDACLGSPLVALGSRDGCNSVSKADVHRAIPGIGVLLCPLFLFLFSLCLFSSCVFSLLLAVLSRSSCSFSRSSLLTSSAEGRGPYHNSPSSAATIFRTCALSASAIAAFSLSGRNTVCFCAATRATFCITDAGSWSSL